MVHPHGPSQPSGSLGLRNSVPSSGPIIRCSCSSCHISVPVQQLYHQMLVQQLRHQCAPAAGAPSACLCSCIISMFMQQQNHPVLWCSTSVWVSSTRAEPALLSPLCTGMALPSCRAIMQVTLLFSTPNFSDKVLSLR